MNPGRGAVLAAVTLFAGGLSAETANPLRFLPRGMIARAAISDSSGNIYIGGGSTSGRVTIAKLAAGGSDAQTLFTALGDDTDSITSLAVDREGALYAAGNTFSPDFPAIATLGTRASREQGRAFVLKLDRDGALRYATTVGHSTTHGSAIAVNANGEALLSGIFSDGGTPAIVATPGAVGRETPGSSGFLVKLDRSGTEPLMAIRGFGQGPVAFDGSGNIYVAGTVWGPAEVPVSEGAFQTTHEFRICGGGLRLIIPCSYQYVAKISPDGTKLLYSTYVTGVYGAVPGGIAVDADGNVTVAGTTNSNDYPVTPGAFQTEYRASNRRPGVIQVPASTGFITKVNTDGTGLVWSTFFGGSGSESVSALRVAPDGSLVIAGLAGSRDLPGAQSVPKGCEPGVTAEPYVARLNADGSAFAGSRYVWGFESGFGPSLALRPDGTPVIADRENVAEVDLAARTPLACVTDPADRARINRVAPGELITLYGEDFGEESATVSIDGVAAPLLYTSRQQINAQVPAELADRDVAQLRVLTGSGETLERPLRMVARAPSAFLDLEQVDRFQSGVSCRGASYSPAYPPIARNEDGSLNTCETPASPGSVVTLYLNGVGLAAPVASLQYPSGTVLGLEPDPDSPPGVWRLRVRLRPAGSFEALYPLIDGLPVRPSYLAIWVRQQ